jgi:hypothetical protein
MDQNFILPEEKTLVNLSSDVFSHFGLRTESGGIGLNYRNKNYVSYCWMALAGIYTKKPVLNSKMK